MELRVAGVTFATLFSSIPLAAGDVEGFLLGSVVRKTEQILVDETGQSAQNNTAQTTHTQQYVLRHFMVTGSSGSFYDNAGQIQPDRLRALIRKGEQDGLRVLGWFRARRHSPPRLTIRESMVWRGMLQLGPRHGHFDLFSIDPLCALITLSAQANTSALTYDYRFIDPSVGVLDPAVCNLGSSSAKEYRELSVMWANANGLPPAYAPQIAHSPAITALEVAHTAALTNLVDLARRAQEAQQQCVDLEEEIASLQKRIAAGHTEETD